MSRTKTNTSSFLLISIVANLLACSPSTNINQFLISKKQANAIDVQLSKAEFYYDKGEFDLALEHAEHAYELSPKNEAVGVLLGYINLALAGIDTFQLAKGLIGLSSSSKTKLASSSSSAADTLNKLRPILGITDSDILKLGDVQDSDEFEAFEGLPVIHPFKVSKVRKSSPIETIRYIHSAVTYICPFVDTEVKIEGDERHSEKNCPETENSRNNRAKSHFIWAFAHLAEALAFNAVVLFQEDGNEKPNIELRTAALSSAGLGIADYVSHVDQLSSDISSIFAVTDPDSQIVAVLNDLTTVSKAFARLAGIPESVTAGIDKALESIKKKSKQIGTGDDTSALKNQFTAKLGKELASQIDNLPAAGSEGAPTAAELEELCDSYDSITAGGSSPPDACG